MKEKIKVAVEKLESHYRLAGLSRKDERRLRRKIGKIERSFIKMRSGTNIPRRPLQLAGIRLRPSIRKIPIVKLFEAQKAILEKLPNGVSNDEN